MRIVINDTGEFIGEAGRGGSPARRIAAVLIPSGDG